MKKIIVLLLITLFLFALIGCGGISEEEEYREKDLSITKAFREELDAVTVIFTNKNLLDMDGSDLEALKGYEENMKALLGEYEALKTSETFEEDFGRQLRGLQLTYESITYRRFAVEHILKKEYTDANVDFEKADELGKEAQEYLK